VAFTGRLGEGVSLEEGQAAARLCAINLIAQARAALSDLDRVRRVVRLGGFVASAADFTDQPKVINGASDLMVEIFGEAGRHARAAVGVNVLPLGAAVEIDAVFEVA
jgi:enamine deaminase RidA (YjgF/YER057c/UK114 family)